MRWLPLTLLLIGCGPDKPTATGTPSTGSPTGSTTGTGTGSSTGTGTGTGSGSGTGSGTGTGTGGGTGSGTGSGTGTGTGTGAARTPCPPTAGLSCERTTEVCVVVGPIGPAEISSCEPVPTACQADRSCTCLEDPVCPSQTVYCADRADNTIYCDNGTQ